MNPQDAAQFLESFFTKDRREKLVEKYLARKANKKVADEAKKIASKIRIVLIDELDALITSKQTLLYNLFNWPCS